MDAKTIDVFGFSFERGRYYVYNLNEFSYQSLILSDNCRNDYKILLIPFILPQRIVTRE